ncbi:MAG: hypothetical protein [Caudoviricetes sp.]|nr:MAG: hypothetical protein [Caudoviricetes sp.]
MAACVALRSTRYSSTNLRCLSLSPTISQTPLFFNRPDATLPINHAVNPVHAARRCLPDNLQIMIADDMRPAPDTQLRREPAHHAVQPIKRYIGAMPQVIRLDNLADQSLPLPHHHAHGTISRKLHDITAFDWHQNFRTKKKPLCGGLVGVSIRL